MKISNQSKRNSSIEVLACYGACNLIRSYLRLAMMTNTGMNFVLDGVYHILFSTTSPLTWYAMVFFHFPFGILLSLIVLLLLCVLFCPCLFVNPGRFKRWLLMNHSYWTINNCDTEYNLWSRKDMSCYIHVERPLKWRLKSYIEESWVMSLECRGVTQTVSCDWIVVRFALVETTFPCDLCDGMWPLTCALW